MSSKAIPEMTPAEFLSHFGRLSAGAGGLRRERNFVRRCLVGAIAASRRLSPTGVSMTWTGDIVLDPLTPRCRGVPAVVTGNPVELEDRFDAIDQMEFHEDAGAIVGTLVGYPSLLIRVGDRVEISPADCFGG